MKNNTFRKYTKGLAILCFAFLVLGISCKKQDEWLDAKANKSDVVPKTLKDLQGILDYDVVMNITPGMGLLGMDNYYVPYTNWQAAQSSERNAYTWALDIYEGASSIDWNLSYQKIELANIVLEGLDEITMSSLNQNDYNQIKGSALFFRAQSLFDLSSLFAKPYNNAANTDLGIPIRTTGDVNIKSVRSTVKETFDQIISDLKQAESFLPLTTVYQTRPSKVAAQALLARVYLNMEDYTNAGQYANTALGNYSTLIDFNTLPTTRYPFPVYPGNKEVIFYSQAYGYGIIMPALNNDRIDTILYASYDPNDLRKIALYSTLSGARTIFDGAYCGSTGNLFSGLATNELYLIRAECLARKGSTTDAISDLNTLLTKRWKSGSFVPFTASSADDALNKILVERNKELPFTSCIRWDDLRRLNKDTRFAKTITRNLNGQIYTLPPNDNRYVYPIPNDELKLSGIQQNPR